MSDPQKDPRTLMKGLKVHREADWDYWFWRPTNWHRYDMMDQYGFIYAPGEDPRTGFYVLVADLSDALDDAVTEEDLPSLRDGILEGLRTLNDCEILEQKEIAKELAIGFEILITFALDGEMVKRRMRLLYNDRQQFTIYGQGVPPSEYDVFHDTFEFIYSTFTFGDLMAQFGRLSTPESATQWRGEGKGVQTKPKVPRDHSARIKKRRAGMERRIRGQEGEPSQE
jgi:hypothetical protein